MRHLSAAGQQAVDDAAARHGFRPAAVARLLEAMLAGHGRMAQFDDPEFGGHGQWMRGGMTMIGDMFNTTLKARVERLCDELAATVATADEADDRRFFIDPPVRAERWWPAELGWPDAAGAQNDMRYAYFARPRRLAIQRGGAVAVYDALDHHIEGVAQQQGAHGSMTFSTRHGEVDLATLPVVGGAAAPSPVAGEPAARPSSEPDIFETIEKLAQLHSKGILSDAEFADKKAELLSRL